ncbi:MAG TPA: acetyl-CoA carboxylase biotin carboxylase subunit [Chloroflexi bacterium]|jgi:acetyl-CoA carboxylase biotin carboxylase subunit|nr:acetyl-CoA carboxylase biotin carboxylase subunit [Chloroflexota bacterium]HAL26579.1 acetyl-CoA carboxylase biotin carboxylase subunit [Chloroflexota bacterium]
MRFRKVLVANRGEIALRVIRTCRELGIATATVYSDIDRLSPHVRAADEAYPIGGAAPRDSYLHIERIIAVAKRAGCDAIHPGYGFLSENADFADAVAAAGIAFVGPPGTVQRALGEKTSARRLAAAAGVPVAEGTMEPLRDEADARTVLERVGYPVLLKPAGGGGGKGMRIVRSAAELPAAWRAATGEATTAFGAPALLMERLIEHARHVEVQLLADAHGTVVWLGERDCSIQRRHQKLIEETPGPSVDDALRATLGAAAVTVASAAGYVNAGTVEFLVAPDGAFVFLEMNTRLQVEHPVTELVTGLDLVALQLRVAAGEPLPFGQPEVRRSGAAIELRITAEDPFAGFLPQAGRVDFVRDPSGPGIRLDSGLAVPLTIPTEYDPLLAKLIAWGPDRPAAIARARRAAREMIVAGLPTSLPFHSFVLAEPDFVAGRYDTDYVARHWDHPRTPEITEGAALATALAGLARLRAGPRPFVGDTTPWSRSAREDMLR